eukprot:g54106.t1
MTKYTKGSILATCPRLRVETASTQTGPFKVKYGFYKQKTHGSDRIFLLAIVRADLEVSSAWRAHEGTTNKISSEKERNATRARILAAVQLAPIFDNITKSTASEFLTGCPRTNLSPLCLDTTPAPSPTRLSKAIVAEVSKLGASSLSTNLTAPSSLCWSCSTPLPLLPAIELSFPVTGTAPSATSGNPLMTCHSSLVKNVPGNAILPVPSCRPRDPNQLQSKNTSVSTLTPPSPSNAISPVGRPWEPPSASEPASTPLACCTPWSGDPNDHTDGHRIIPCPWNRFHLCEVPMNRNHRIKLIPS